MISTDYIAAVLTLGMAHRIKQKDNMQTQLAIEYLKQLAQSKHTSFYAQQASLFALQKLNLGYKLSAKVQELLNSESIKLSIEHERALQDLNNDIKNLIKEYEF